MKTKRKMTCTIPFMPMTDAQKAGIAVAVLGTVGLVWWGLSKKSATTDTSGQKKDDTKPAGPTIDHRLAIDPVTTPVDVAKVKAKLGLPSHLWVGDGAAQVTGSVLDPGYSQSAYSDPLYSPNATVSDLAKTWQDLALANPGSEPPTTMLVSVGANDGGTDVSSLPGSVHTLTDTLLSMFGRVVWILSPAIDARIIAEIKKSSYEYIYTTLDDAEIPAVQKLLLGSPQTSASASLGGPITAIELLHSLNVVIPIKKGMPGKGGFGPPPA